MFGSHSQELKDRDKLYAKSIKRRGSYFKLKNELLTTSQKEGISMYDATPEEMREIKVKIKAQKAET
jgi:hypothetical protein